MSASDPLQPLDVIWLFHGTARGARKRRMMVCISPHDGLFLPINTANHHRPCFRLSKAPHHDWLDHDSHVECNVLEYDEYEIEQSIETSGTIGYLHLSHVQDILDGLARSTGIRAGDRELIVGILSGFRAEHGDD